MIICTQCDNKYPDNYDYCPRCRQVISIIIELIIKMFRTGLKVKKDEDN
jgi:hypothetical protein